MQLEYLEGIVLKSHLYQESHRIITVFTSQLGMINILARGIRQPKKLATVASFAELDLICRKKKSELYSLKEASVICDHHFLREKWSYLMIAGKMGQLILQTQMGGKASPLLYQFFSRCLKHIPYFEEIETLGVLFYLKFFIHEGYISGRDRENFPFPLTQEEWSILKKLAIGTSFSDFYAFKGLGKFLKSLEEMVQTI